MRRGNASLDYARAATSLKRKRRSREDFLRLRVRLVCDTVLPNARACAQSKLGLGTTGVQASQENNASGAARRACGLRLES